MIVKHTAIDDVFADLESQHRNVLKEIEQFSDALNNLRYEGKVSLSKNIRKIDEALIFFNTELLPHMRFDEKAIFPFLEKHVPRLDPVISLFRSEHAEFRTVLKSFEGLFLDLKKKHDLKRSSLIEKLRDKGIYLACLIRNHIQAESDSVYRILDAGLKKKEKEQFLEKCKIFL